MSEPCRLLEWDSAFFGFTVAQVVADSLSPAGSKAVSEWCEAHGVRCLYFLADASSTETAETGHKAGFNMVDGRLGLVRDASAPEFASKDRFEVVTADLADVPALEAIARAAHTDSRFFFDRHFPFGRAEDLFALWISADCAGRADRVFTVRGEDNEPSGYVTCSLIDERTGRIGLIGTSARHRGLGLGTALVSTALKWFATAGVTSVKVVTQVRNVSAQRLYQKAGFRTENVRIWYHRWW